MPDYLLNTGPGYLEWRSQELARGRRGLRTAHLSQAVRSSGARGMSPPRSTPGTKGGRPEGLPRCCS